MANDAHDTDVNFVSAWLEYFLVPLLQNPLFNSNRTLIQLTFDENETYDVQNNVYTILLGNAVPQNLKGTNDTTFYTHYSLLSSVQNNWDLPSLGRQDTNKTVAAVWDFQAKQTNYTNYVPQANEIPLLNLTGMYPGSLNPNMWVPIPAPNTTAQGAGDAKVFYNASGLDLNLTSASVLAMAPLNFTALGLKNELNVNPNFTYTGAGASVINASSPAASAASSAAANPTGKGKGSGAGRVVVSAAGVVVAAAAVAFAL